MKEKKPNGYKKRWEKQSFKRNILKRLIDYPEFQQEFEHLEKDTIVGVHPKSAIITLKPKGREVLNIEKITTDWLQKIV